MSHTMTFGMMERTTKFVQTREAILRLALSSIVVALITTQMPFEYSLNRGNPADAEYAGNEAVVSLPEGEVIEIDETFPAKKLRMVQTWIDIHEEELMSDWRLAAQHGEVFKIRGLDQP